MIMRIKAKHPVRNAITSTPTYWEKPGRALNELSEVLGRHGFVLDDIASFDDYQQSYRANYHLRERSTSNDPFHVGPETESMLVFMWYKLATKYEVTAYLS